MISCFMLVTPTRATLGPQIKALSIITSEYRSGVHRTTSQKRIDMSTDTFCGCIVVTDTARVSYSSFFSCFPTLTDSGRSTFHNQSLSESLGRILPCRLVAHIHSVEPPINVGLFKVTDLGRPIYPSHRAILILTYTLKPMVSYPHHPHTCSASTQV